MDAESTPHVQPAEASTAQRARKRRPPSPSGLAKRKAAIARANAEWHQMKLAGRWKENE